MDENRKVSSLEDVDPWLRFSEIRTGPGGKFTIIANSRRDKPEPGKGEGLEACIFCPDKRRLDPPIFEDKRLEEMRKRGFYVLGNKYAVTTPPQVDDGPLAYKKMLGAMWERNVFRGFHSLSINKDHNINPFSDSELTKNYYRDEVWVYRTMLAWFKEQGCSWGGIGKNRNGSYSDGKVIPAGASQPHPHSQGAAVYDFYPPWLMENIEQFRNDLEFRTDSAGAILSGCPSCIEARFIPLSGNVIERNNFFISYTNPTPSLLPSNQYEIIITPFNHQSRFDDITDEHAEYFADILHKTMQKFSKLGNPGFNFVLHQGPWNAQYRHNLLDSFHWQFKIYPAYSRKTEKHDGFMSLLLGVPVLTEPSESLASRLNS